MERCHGRSERNLLPNDPDFQGVEQRKDKIQSTNGDSRKSPLVQLVYALSAIRFCKKKNSIFDNHISHRRRNREGLADNNLKPTSAQSIRSFRTKIQKISSNTRSALYRSYTVLKSTPGSDNGINAHLIQNIQSTIYYHKNQLMTDRKLKLAPDIIKFITTALKPKSEIGKIITQSWWDYKSTHIISLCFKLHNKLIPRFKSMTLIPKKFISLTNIIKSITSELNSLSLKEITNAKTWWISILGASLDINHDLSGFIQHPLNIKMKIKSICTVFQTLTNCSGTPRQQMMSQQGAQFQNTMQRNPMNYQVPMQPTTQMSQNQGQMYNPNFQTAQPAPYPHLNNFPWQNQTTVPQYQTNNVMTTPQPNFNPQQPTFQQQPNQPIQQQTNQLAQPQINQTTQQRQPQAQPAGPNFVPINMPPPAPIAGDSSTHNEL